MARNVGQTLLRIISILGALTILGIVVLTASTTLMPGTKVRRLFGASPEALANTDDTREKPAATGSDAGTPATGEQGR